MCGIYGLVSSRNSARSPGDDVFRHLDVLLETAEPTSLSGSLSVDATRKQIIDELEAAKSASQLWTERAACLALLSDGALRDRITRIVKRVESWVGVLETLLTESRAEFDEHQETLNALIVGGKDVAWRLSRDVMGVLEPIDSLVNGATDEHVLARAWELNLTLRSLDRLEVRGRDSAGISVYARFPSSDDLDRFLEAKGRRSEFEERCNPRFVDRSVLRPDGDNATLVFAFKVASEVGKMGDNVSTLRRSITEDALFQSVLRERDVECGAISHTRWASNGVISLPNCHPVDSTLVRDGEVSTATSGKFVAVLNGDIDNYQALVDQYVRDTGAEIDPAITTDAKIIPVVVAHHHANSSPLEEAFQKAFAEFEGSMAIGLAAIDRPGEFLFAQKGSGQGMFFGVGAESVAVASEMYGVVELTSRYVKAEGERHECGEIFRLRSCEDSVDLELFDGENFGPIPADRFQTAEITTRDINRAQFPHFFLKEISESVDSVAKTFRGKIDLLDSGELRCRLGGDAIPVALVNGLREGRVRRIVVIGQGTAAVAAQGVAHLLNVALRRSPHSIAIRAEKATEFSAHGLHDDMGDTLVVAVSQSGTTTDTNRTVDLVRQRGAWVLGIVNRRNSDLVYKSHAVLYTSDGRDIEMSVASTKAFYAQNVAGQVLALTLGSALETMTASELREAVEELRALPDALRQTLELSDHIKSIADEFAMRRRHWAVVGSGGSKIAADEIRIKLSELCYKSIAVDYLEDKKHIDLSSEPLVIVCAVGMASDVVSDAVKEVAIFKAHSAIPIVITEQGEDDFDPYAAGTIKVPRCHGALSFLPATMAGHLFGYHAAVGMDVVADRLRSLRSAIVTRQEELGFGDERAPEILDDVSTSKTNELVALEELLDEGRLDGGVEVGQAVRLSRVLQLCLRRVSIDGFARRRVSNGGVMETVLSTISDSVAELSRPVDAIKHQAKTVTVGISRGEATATRGKLFEVFDGLGVPQADLLESHRAFLSAFEPLVDTVKGATLYRLSGLDALGWPQESTRVAVERKIGCARDIPSRCESESALSGQKWAVAKIRDVHLGRGQSDGRRILIVPMIGESSEGHLVLFHVELIEQGPRDARMRALTARGRQFDRLKGAVTEVHLDWEPELIDSVDNDTLFLSPPDAVAAELAQARV